MNRELLRNVRDAIGAEADRFEMMNWITGPKAGESLNGDCGTAGCLAGHLVFQGAKMGLVQGFASSWASVVIVDGHERGVSELALELLDVQGILDDDPDGWGLLFGMANWPRHYTRDQYEHYEDGRLDRSWQAKMAMDLIDDILDDLTVYDAEQGVWVYLPDDAVAEDEDEVLA